MNSADFTNFLDFICVVDSNDVVHTIDSFEFIIKLLVFYNFTMDWINSHFTCSYTASDEGFDNKMENNTKLKRVRRGLVEENIRLRKQVIDHTITPNKLEDCKINEFILIKENII